MALSIATNPTSRLLTCAATTALTLGLVVTASAQNVRLDPTFGLDGLEPGFNSTSITIQAGGDIDAATSGERCNGFIADAPDYAFDYLGSAALTITVASDQDTTLRVVTPSGEVLCNDDFDGLNPGLNLAGGESGRFFIWVGTFVPIGNNTFPDADIFISEDAAAPGPGQRPAPAPGASLDPQGQPAFGAITVGSGFGTQTLDLQAGGDQDAFAFDQACAGFVAVNPDFIVDVLREAGGRPLGLSVESAEDTTLVVLGPNGAVFCNDDANGTLNPALSIAAPVVGEYAVWVGTFSSLDGTFPDAALTVSSGQASSPAPRPAPATPTPPSQSSVDFNALPTFGDVRLGAELAQGYSVQLQAGGMIDGFQVSNDCNGFIADVPDFVLDYAGGNTPLVISVASQTDTTLLVLAPDGTIACNDDDFDLNPALTFNPAQPGRYTIFVGTFSAIENDFFPDATLTFGSASANGGGRSDRALLDPAYGRVDLDPGFAQHTVEIQAGGEFSGSDFGPTCNGFMADAPDYVIGYFGDAALQITTQSTEDTTIAVITPSGEVLCNDDFRDLNAGLITAGDQQGDYAVWVGTFNAIQNNIFPTTTLTVEEVSSTKVQPSGAITSIALTAGFTPDPFTTVLAAGGFRDASMLDPQCWGNVAAQPDFVLNYTAGAWPLRVFVTADVDTTLVMRLPSGEFMCNDDTDGLNPALSLPTPQSGRYEVYIGTYDPSAGTPNATLAITEILDEKVLPQGAITSIDVDAGMARQDFDLLAGGSFSAFDTFGNSCNGFVATIPDFNAFVVRAGVDLELTARSAEDTTMVVEAPDGQIFCDDDSAGDLNPLLLIENAQAGTYNIWLGTFSASGNAPVVLSVSDQNAGSTTPPNVPGGGKK